MRAALTYALRACLEAVAGPVERAAVALVLGPLGLSLAHVEPANVVEALMAWWGACAGLYGLATLAVSAIGIRPVPEAE